jgi:hypothetical protein
MSYHYTSTRYRLERGVGDDTPGPHFPIFTNLSNILPNTTN